MSILRRFFRRRPPAREAETWVVEQIRSELRLVEGYDYAPFGDWPAVPNKHGRVSHSPTSSEGAQHDHA